MPIQTPEKTCSLCPRLVDYRQTNQSENKQWFNGAVPSFGDDDAELLIVGLAPGVQGANRTGRPFTGDYAGDLLYATLEKFGFSNGSYGASINDGLRLKNCRITNAVRCVPPQNKPIGAEINNCRQFLISEIENLKNLKIMIALGRVSHESVVLAMGEKKAHYPFAHAAEHKFGSGLLLIDSYHCSRYNTNTGRLTPEMFEDVFTAVKKHL